MISTNNNNGLTTITLDRPEKLNAFAGTMRQELRDALMRSERDAATRAVVITGAGRAFCAGGDVEAMSALQRERDTTAFQALLDAGRDVILTIAAMEKPVVAAINGVAAGAGCNLALACDYRIASSKAKLGETFIRIGLHPDWGGTWLLPRLVGRSRAFELCATGRMVDAAEALAIGMIDRMVEPEALADEVAAFASVLAAAPPIALRGLKRALAAGDRNSLSAQLELEASHQIAAFQSGDATEGMTAFFEKRPARFNGT